MCTDTIESHVPNLEELRARWRAHARYSIARQRRLSHGYVTDIVGKGGLTYDEGKALCTQLDHAAWAQDGHTAASFCRTMHTLRLENPLPNKRKTEEQQHTPME